MATTKTKTTSTAMRPSVRRTTASSQTTIGTTRTTSSSPSTTPMTTLTYCTCTSTDAWRTCTEPARASFHSWFMMIHAHLMAQVLSAFSYLHPWSSTWRTLFDSTSPFFFFLFLLSVTVFFFHLELFTELLNTKYMANNLRCSAAEKSEDTLNVSTTHTGDEPNLLAFDELYDSSVPFSFMIPSRDQDVDDVTLSEMLTAGHRGQVNYCVPGGMSVSRRL